MAGGQDQLAPLRTAIAPYHDIDAAQAQATSRAPADGCVRRRHLHRQRRTGGDGDPPARQPPNGRLDATLDPVNPEALLYERRNDGTLKLTGVEYIVAQRHGYRTHPCRGRPSTGSRSRTANLGRFGELPDHERVDAARLGSSSRTRGGMFDPLRDRRTGLRALRCDDCAEGAGQGGRCPARLRAADRQRAAAGRSSCPNAARSTNSPTPGSATSSPALDEHVPAEQHDLRRARSPPCPRRGCSPSSSAASRP